MKLAVVIALWAIAGSTVMAAVAYCRRTMPEVPTGRNEIEEVEADNER